MIAIKFQPHNQTKDEAIKEQAATKQLSDLVKRVSGGLKYRLLTQSDRATLETEGFAKDLVNNIAFFTQRLKTSKNNQSTLGDTDYLDQKMEGFTYAAFDPSIYATQRFKQHLRKLNVNKCSFCECSLAESNSGDVYHFRPASIIFNDQVTLRSPYFSIGFKQDNLLLTCFACSQTHKKDQFPVKGQRFPQCSLNDEQALLVNPYQDEPRNYIRFNPLNGCAYAFDQVSDYLQTTQQLTQEQVGTLLWKNPQLIPLQYDAQGNPISNTNNDTCFKGWLIHNNKNYRGQQTIDIIGLNRKALQQARKIHLYTFFNEFSAKQQKPPQKDDIKITEKNITTYSYMAQYQFNSLIIDALNTWSLTRIVTSNNIISKKAQSVKNNTETPKVQSNKNVDDSKNPPIQNTEKTMSTINWYNIYTAKNLIFTEQEKHPNVDGIADEPSINQTSLQHIPSWLMSSLSYLVLESELTLKNKRRIIFLHARDKVYGGDLTEKCIFENINWQKDLSNIIKVRSKRNTWETSFVELAESRPLEIIELFANNEIWAEGDYLALHQE